MVVVGHPLLLSPHYFYIGRNDKPDSSSFNCSARNGWVKRYLLVSLQGSEEGGRGSGRKGRGSGGREKERK